tara:strand:- start:314 stop:1141 length:828 start_codon:yes stop_codon:yes gene_type:complete
MSGTLYIVSTPIGNLTDISLRALEVLKNSDYILAESSARTSKLLNEYTIKKKIITFNKDNEKRKRLSIIKDIEKGSKVALVSDAGTPVISDPGFELIKNLGSASTIVPVPGASSLTTAISVSKIPLNNFMFLGFLPKKSIERKTQLLRIKDSLMPAIVFESKHRLVAVLSEIIEVMGPQTNVGVLRELTKIHEEISFGASSDLLTRYSNNPPSGEITLIIGTSSNKPTSFHDLDAQILKLSKQYSASEVVNIIRMFHVINKKELYKYVLNIRHEG